MLLGVGPDGVAVFAADPGPERGAALRPERASGSARRRVLVARGRGLLAHAAGLLNWHRRHRFCANCGAPTDIARGRARAACPSCGAQHHPRTDPVVIMLVHRRRPRAARPPGELARAAYSALAGFVEPGETLEEAVAREVREEAGVAVADARYVASQPWPFPASLMLGFDAPYLGGEPRRGDGELEDVRWFTRDELAAAAAGEGEVSIPPPLAIARRLMDGWLRAGD